MTQSHYSSNSDMLTSDIQIEDTIRVNALSSSRAVNVLHNLSSWQDDNPPSPNPPSRISNPTPDMDQGTTSTIHYV